MLKSEYGTMKSIRDSYNKFCCKKFSNNGIYGKFQ